MSFQSPSVYVCSNDAAELIDIYDPNYDDDSYLNLPENFNELSLYEQEALKGRRETLLEFVSNLNEEKRRKVNQIIATQSAMVLICPTCKKIYDTQSMTMKEKTHSDNNLIPMRKPKEHKVVSDDKESMDKATSSAFDMGSFARQIYFPDNEGEGDNVQVRSGEGDSGTSFGRSESGKSFRNIRHAAKTLEAIIEKYGKENVNIQIDIGNTDIKNNQ